MLRIVYGLIIWFCALSAYSWNATGHKLVAQIAYDNLTPEAKKLCNQYNRALNKFSRSGNFVVAATWLDAIRAKDIHWFDSLHYIDIPFSKDDTPLPPVPETNALLGIKHAMEVLKSPKASPNDKGLSLRVLTHVVGDIHQPLHTVSQITNALPKGDLGGNLFLLGKNPIGTNLHQYWDNGGGILIGQSKKFQIKNKAKQLEQKWPCAIVNKLNSPEKWVDASHEIALHAVYTLNPGAIPSKNYQLTAQNLTQKQIVLAGCRLASLLNSLA
ncbi:MAG: nuclease [Legionella sp.]|nr:MAG: nuclease [Legionella sp.]